MRKTGTRLISLLTALCLIVSMFAIPGVLPAVEVKGEENAATVPEAVTKYLDATFEPGDNGTVDMTGVTLAPGNAANKAEIMADSYLYLEKNASGIPTAALDLSSLVDSHYVAVSMDIASKKAENIAVKLTGASWTQTLVTIGADGKILSGDTDTQKSLTADGEFMNIVIAVNSASNTYCLWIDDVCVVNDATIGTETFGDVSALAIELSDAPANGQNVMIDNLQVYGWSPAVAGQTYCNVDFEGGDQSKVTTSVRDGGQAAYMGGDGENHYLKLTGGVGGASRCYGYVNKSGDALAEKVVFEADIAVGNIGRQIVLKAYGQSGSVEALKILPNGDLRAYNYWDAGCQRVVGNVPTDSATFAHVAIAIDATAKTHTVWVDGSVVIDKLALPAAFTGNAAYFEVDVGYNNSSNGGGAICMVDNIKLFEGEAPSATGDSAVAVPEATKSFYANAFEQANLGGFVLTANGDANKVAVLSNNNYVYLERNTDSNPAVTGAVTAAEVADYLIVSADIAATKIASMKLNVRDAAGELAFAGLSAEGKVTSLDADTAKLFNADGALVNFTIAINSKQDMYSLWVDGQSVIRDNPIPRDFGTVAAVSVVLTGNGNLLVDNLKVSAYDGSVPSNQPEIPADLGNNVYYTIDFEEAEDMGDILKLIKNDSTVTMENGYLKIAQGAEGGAYDCEALVNYGGKALSKYMVFQMDVASKDLGSTVIRIYGETGSIRALEFADNNGSWEIRNSAKKRVAFLPKDGSFVNVAIAVNAETKTYYAWVDGVLVVDALAADIGMPQYLNFGLTTDNKEFLVDNIWIFDGVTFSENVPVKPVIPDPEPEVPSDLGSDVYYVLDFEKEEHISDILKLIKNDSAVTVEKDTAGNHYLKIAQGVEGGAYDCEVDVNYGGVNLSKYVVFQMDIASTAFGSTALRIYGETGSLIALQFGENKGNWEIRNSKREVVGQLPQDGSFVNVAIAINTEKKIYYAWIDGKMAVNSLPADIGTPKYLNIGVTNDSKNFLVDNIWIYDGVKFRNEAPVIAEKPVPVPESPADMGSNVYYVIDFSKKIDMDDIGKIIKNDSSATRVVGADGNGYMMITQGAQGGAYDCEVLVNYDGVPLSKYVVFQMDIASTNLGTTAIRVYGEKGSVQALQLGDNKGVWEIRNVNRKKVATLPKDGSFVNVAFAINTESKTYSAWIDGKPVVEDMPADIGMPKYLNIALTNDNKNLMVDNIWIYDGVFRRETAPTLPPKPVIDTGTDRFYDNNFESKNKEELIFFGGAGFSKEANGNHSVLLPTPGANFLWNYNAKWDLNEYMVMEADISSTELGTVLFTGYGETGKAIHFVKVRQDGTMEPRDTATEAKLLKGQWVRVSIAINAKDKTYSVWYDGELVRKNAKYTTEFGDLYYWVFTLSAGTPTANVRVDNLKVYNGLTPEDYSKTKLITHQERDDSWMQEWVGKESPILDYATEELKKIDAAGAVVINTDTRYVYQNGKRIEMTQAQIDALLKNVAGKKVVKNGMGLVIISSTNLNLTDEEIHSLHDYMLYTRPTAATLKSLFNAKVAGKHPRIMLDQAKFDRIRADYKTNELVKKWADSVIKQADVALKSGHVSQGQDSVFRTVLDRSMCLSMAYKLTGNVQYKNFLWEDLQITCSFTNWMHSRDYLGTAEFATGVAIAYDWLYHDWTPNQRKIMEKAIYDNALYYHHKYMYGVLLPGLGTYITSTTNRNAVCNGGVGMAAMAVFEVYPDACADILEKNYHMMEFMMDEYSPDGANTEGPAYWEYQMQFLSKFLASSMITFGSDFNFLDVPGFDTTGEYYMHIDGMAGVNNFHDAGATTHASKGYLFWLSNTFNKPELTQALLLKMDQYELPGNIYSLVYYNSDIKMGSNIALPKDAYFGGVEVVTMRSSWLNGAGHYISAHTGVTNIGAHAHIDSGTFVADLGGQRFAGDYGKEEYGLAATGSYRHYYYRIRPEGHNVFVINPDKTGEDIGQNAGAAEVISKFESKDRGAYTIMSLDSAYEGYAKSATRGLMLGDDRNSILIRDEIRGMNLAQNEVWWFMQMQGVTVEIASDGRSAILEKNGVRVHLQVASDNATDWEIKVLEPKTMYPKANLADADKQDANDGWSRLAIVFKSGKDLNINVKMALEEDKKGDTPIQNVSLANWSVPDGILKETPTVQSIKIGGKDIPNFKSMLTYYNYALPFGTTECPEVSVIGGENCDIKIKMPKKLPGTLKITVTNKSDPDLETVYRINLTVDGPISVTASDWAESWHPKNSIDKDIKTRFSLSGEGWIMYTFPEPTEMDAVWIMHWVQSDYHRLFDILVSEDGENFTEVMKVKTPLTPASEGDQMREYKIPVGKYKAIKLMLHGGETSGGAYYPWNSIIEIEFYRNGKPVEVKGLVRPDDNIVDNVSKNEKPNDDTNNNMEPTAPADPDGEVTDQTDAGSKTGAIWWIVGIGAAVAAAVTVVIVVLKKKKNRVPKTEETQVET